MTDPVKVWKGRRVFSQADKDFWDGQVEQDARDRARERAANVAFSPVPAWVDDDDWHRVSQTERLWHPEAD